MHAPRARPSGPLHTAKHAQLFFIHRVGVGFLRSRNFYRFTPIALEGDFYHFMPWSAAHFYRFTQCQNSLPAPYARPEKPQTPLKHATSQVHSAFTSPLHDPPLALPEPTCAMPGCPPRYRPFERHKPSTPARSAQVYVQHINLGPRSGSIAGRPQA